MSCLLLSVIVRNKKNIYRQAIVVKQVNYIFVLLVKLVHGVYLKYEDHYSEETTWVEVISLLISVFAIIVFHLPGVKWQFISVEKPQEE